jgi:biotin synthase
MKPSELREGLETEGEQLEELRGRADAVRRETVGEEVHLRGLVEISNHCRRRCSYCGLRAPNQLSRYRLNTEEILACARQAVSFGYGTVVLQSGEDPGIGADWLAGIIRQIKTETNLAVTLSLGEREPEALALWREAGADRYLLRFETSNRALYDRLHPPVARKVSDRIALLRQLRSLGYEIGSGVMVGLPGQSREDLVNDLLLFAELDLDMIGLGPYIPHPATPLAQESEGGAAMVERELLTYKMLALARLVCPGANIPSTTALATINAAQGRELGLQGGANVIMPELTPVKYRGFYEIYPGKTAGLPSPEECCRQAKEQIAGIGRLVGQGRGDSARRRIAV